MATKDLTFKDNQDILIKSNFQHNNLNLNQNQKSFLNAFSELSKTVLKEKKKSLDYVLLKLLTKVAASIIKLLDSKTKKDFHSWKKSAKDLSSNFVKNDNDSEKVLKKERNSSINNNGSTLSLHIETYENSSIEANSFDGIKTKQNGLKTENVKQAFVDSKNSVIRNPFEFPRQQENNEAKMPEVAKYKTSQQLFNPNQMEQTKKEEKMSNEKENRKLTVRRATSPTYLEVETNASETGFKTIKTDRGSDRNASKIIQSPPIQAQSPKSPTKTALSPTPTTARSSSPLTAISPPPLTAKRAQTARTIVVMRHGERLDDLFGEWYSYCKNKNGKYRQRDLNMPPDLSPLNRPLDEYENDTALTVLGHVLAQMVGRAMLVSGRSPDMVYCSPSLRCVQTASVAAAMTGKPFKLRIEPGIFENFDLYTRKTPKFVTVEELKNSGFNIDDDYTPYCKLEDLFSFPETSEMYNDRVQSSLQYIANKSAPGRGTVLVAAHASTVDLAFGKFHPRFLNVSRQTTADNLINISLPIPYSSNVTFMRSSDDDQWQYIREALPPITYRNFSNRLNHDFIERNQTA